MEYSGHRLRLRERFLKNGFEGFADYEIVELLLTLCIPRCDTKRQARALLQKFGNIGNILDAGLNELRDVDGVGEAASVAIKIVKASAELYLRTSIEGKQVFGSSTDLIKFWKHRMRGLCVEVFEVAYLDADLCLLKGGIEEVERGSANRVHVNQRKILELALSKHASCIILAHNHPCGDAKPSDIDETITRKIQAAAECLEITLLDHIIISRVDEFSFHANGLIN